MSKYIIKNCPATYLNFESKYVCTSQIKQKGFPFYCKDCTDCVMKQIVEKCREHHTDLHFTPSEILTLIDIQEVE